MDHVLIQLILLTFVIHVIDTLGYSVRLNSVKTGQVALSFSIFNLFVLVSRTANMFQAPLIGKIIGFSIAKDLDPLSDMRYVIAAATAGTLAGVFVIPTFLKIFQIGVKKIALSGSVPSLVFEALHANNMKRIVKKATVPKKKMLQKLRFREIPKRFLLLHAVVTGIYTIGVLAANYSSLLVPSQNQLAAAASSGMINGAATIMLTFFIDPKSAIITDQAIRGKRPYGDVKALVILLITTKLVGTVLGQLLFLPAAKIIASFYQ